jgi:hypothetical protein
MKPARTNKRGETRKGEKEKETESLLPGSGTWIDNFQVLQSMDSSLLTLQSFKSLFTDFSYVNFGCPKFHCAPMILGS